MRSLNFLALLGYLVAAEHDEFTSFDSEVAASDWDQSYEFKQARDKVLSEKLQGFVDNFNFDFEEDPSERILDRDEMLSMLSVLVSQAS